MACFLRHAGHPVFIENLKCSLQKFLNVIFSAIVNVFVGPPFDISLSFSISCFSIIVYICCMAKLTEIELNNIRDKQYKLLKAKTMIGELEMKKAAILRVAESAAVECRSEEEKLKEKYGDDMEFDIETGELR